MPSTRSATRTFGGIEASYQQGIAAIHAVKASAQENPRSLWILRGNEMGAPPRAYALGALAVAPDSHSVRDILLPAIDE